MSGKPDKIRTVARTHVSGMRAHQRAPLRARFRVENDYVCVYLVDVGTLG